MKSTGEVRKIDRLGRIVIPVNLRSKMDFDLQDPVEIFVDQDMIVLQKFYPACTFCGTKEENENEIYKFSGKTVCKSCFQGVADLNK